MTLKLVESIHERLSDANRNWPRNAFSTAEGRAMILEKRLARAAQGSEVEFCVSAATDDGAGQTRFTASLFTADLVISGELVATDERSVTANLAGDVVIVPRAAIRSLTLHQVEYFGYDNEVSDDYVSFTATYEGMDPVTVGPPSSGAQRGDTTRLFDALRNDLVQA